MAVNTRVASLEVEANSPEGAGRRLVPGAAWKKLTKGHEDLDALLAAAAGFGDDSSDTDDEPLPEEPRRPFFRRPATAPPPARRKDYGSAGIPLYKPAPPPSGARRLRDPLDKTPLPITRAGDKAPTFRDPFQRPLKPRSPESQQRRCREMYEGAGPRGTPWIVAAKRKLAAPEPPRSKECTFAPKFETKIGRRPRSAGAARRKRCSPRTPRRSAARREARSATPEPLADRLADVLLDDDDEAAAISGVAEAPEDSSDAPDESDALDALDGDGGAAAPLDATNSVDAAAATAEAFAALDAMDFDGLLDVDDGTAGGAAARTADGGAARTADGSAGTAGGAAGTAGGAAGATSGAAGTAAAAAAPAVAQASTADSNYGEDDFEDDAADAPGGAAAGGTARWRVGDRVDGNFEGADEWYPGTIARVASDGLVDIQYDDGDWEQGVAPDLVRDIEE